MESKYHYFKRDISWLSFNYRVLLEADDDSFRCMNGLTLSLYILLIWRNSTRFV